MKCLSCGSEIPNNSQSCPFCGAAVEKNENLMETATLPVTPNEIQLPADQAKMENTGTINIVTEDVEMPTPKIEENVEIPEMKVEENIVPEVAVDQVITEPTTEVNVPLEETEPVVITGGNIDVNTGTIDNTLNPEMETVTFSKEQTPTKEKKPFPIKLILIILAIILVVGGCGFGYYYYTQYMSASNRIEAVVDNLFEANLSEVKNDKVERQSGKYNASLNINQNDDIYKIAFNGDYGLDLKSKKMNYSFNLTDLKLSNEVIIDKNNPINLEMFIEESTISLDLVNFFDKYISIQSAEIGSIFNAIEQNDIDYSNIINCLKNATKEAINELSTTQTVDNITFNGKTSKANIVSIKMTVDNQKKFVDKFIDTLLKDDLFMNDMALLSNQTKEELIASLNEAKVNDYTDEGVTVKIATAMFAEELIGVKISDDNTTLDIFAIENGYEFIVTENTTKTFDLSYSYTKEETVKTIDENIVVSLVLNQETGVVKIDLDLSSSSDVNPVIKEKSDKETIPYEYIDAEAQTQIMNNILGYGKLGTILQTYISAFSSTSYEEIETTTACAQAFNCSEPVDGMATCGYANENGEILQVTCPVY